MERKELKRKIMAGKAGKTFMAAAAITAAVVMFILISLPACKAQDSGWRQLFNGKDLTGWKHVGPGSMAVEDGLIKGNGGMGLLYWAGEKFGNCNIKVV